MFQRQSVQRFKNGQAGAPAAVSSIARGVRAAAVVAFAAVVITACASKTDGMSSGGDAFVDEELAAALQEEGPITFIDHAFSSSSIQAQVLAQVFEKFGAETTVMTSANTESGFAETARSVDVFDPEVWRPLNGGSIEKYVETEKTVEVFYESELSGEEGWYVPTYVIEGDAERGIEPSCPGLPDWEALNDCADVFATAQTGDKGQYTLGPPEWASYYGDPQRIENLGLDYEMVFAGSEAALNAEWERAYERGEPFLGLMWTPSYTGFKFDMTRVEFPPYSDECWGTTYACNWDAVDIVGIASVDFRDARPVGSAIIDKYDLSTDHAFQIMSLVEEEGLDPADAVAQWLDENPDVWQAWAP